jgi:hypothetical protein
MLRPRRMTSSESKLGPGNRPAWQQRTLPEKSSADCGKTLKRYSDSFDTASHAGSWGSRCRLAINQLDAAAPGAGAPHHQKTLSRHLISYRVWFPVAWASLRFNVRISSKRLLTSRMIAAIPIIAPDSFFSGAMVNSTEIVVPFL